MSRDSWFPRFMKIVSGAASIKPKITSKISTAFLSKRLSDQGWRLVGKVNCEPATVGHVAVDQVDVAWRRKPVKAQNPTEVIQLTMRIADLRSRRAA